MGVSPGTGSEGSSKPGGYLASAGVARAVCVREVLPVGIHLAVVGAALTAGAAGAWASRLVRQSPGDQGRRGKAGWKADQGGALTRCLGGVLAGGWGAEHSPAHGHPILAGAGCAGLTIWLPLDTLSKLLSTKHTGYSKGLSPWQPRHLHTPLPGPQLYHPPSSLWIYAGRAPLLEGTPLHLQPLEAAPFAAVSPLHPPRHTHT